MKLSLNFVPDGPINYIPALFQIMAWHRPGDKPLSETMMVSLLTQIYVTRPQWVENLRKNTLCKEYIITRMEYPAVCGSIFGFLGNQTL